MIGGAPSTADDADSTSGVADKGGLEPHVVARISAACAAGAAADEGTRATKSCENGAACTTLVTVAAMQGGVTTESEG